MGRTVELVSGSRVRYAIDAVGAWWSVVRSRVGRMNDGLVVGLVALIATTAGGCDHVTSTRRSTSTEQPQSTLLTESTRADTSVIGTAATDGGTATTEGEPPASAIVSGPATTSRRRGCTPVTIGETVRVDELPEQARRTLGAIERGGPFPFRKDGAVFANRERLLPKERRGYYHEYTVPTPGEGDRGARRIVTGRCGERFYTDDHYASFRQIEE